MVTTIFLELLVATAALGVVVAMGVAAYKGSLQFRPFRTSAIAMGLMLLGALYMSLSHDVQVTQMLVDVGADKATAKIANFVVNLVVDVSVMILAIGGYVTSMNRLSDDGGESDTIKAIKIMKNAE